MNLLFDLDGTLTDSRRGILACLRYALHELRLNVPEDAELERFIGPPLKETFAALIGPEDDGRVAQAVLLYRERFAAQGIFENNIYAGIPNVLRRFNDGGFALFVATSKPTVFAERIIEHFGMNPFFRAVYGSELNGANADKKDLLAHLLRAESLPAAHTVMIGDRAHDILGAHVNGIFPVGALWGYGSREELTSAGARLLCDEPESLTDVIPYMNRLPHGGVIKIDDPI